VFGDDVVAAAMIDRPLNPGAVNIHVVVVNTYVESNQHLS
jgi:hypothetical protein